MKLMTKAQWAKHRGIPLQYVEHLVEAQDIELVDGLIDVKSANKMLNTYIQYSRLGTGHCAIVVRMLKKMAFEHMNALRKMTSEAEYHFGSLTEPERAYFSKILYPTLDKITDGLVKWINLNKEEDDYRAVA